MKELLDFPNPDDVFPGTNIRGGVCVLYLSKSYDSTTDLTRVITYENGKVVHDVMRSLSTDGLDIFIRDERSLDIIEKVLSKSNGSMLTDVISPRKPFGLSGTVVKSKNFKSSKAGLDEPVKCFAKGMTGFMERKMIPLHNEWIDNWKVLTARANNIGTELNDDNLNTIIAGPGTACTETYILIGASLNLEEHEVKNLAKYLKTKFVRYLHSLAKSSQDAARSTYRFIPTLNFSNEVGIDWTTSVSRIEQQLYVKYGLSKEEITLIDQKIKD